MLWTTVGLLKQLKQGLEQKGSVCLSMSLSRYLWSFPQLLVSSIGKQVVMKLYFKLLLIWDFPQRRKKKSSNQLIINNLNTRDSSNGQIDGLGLASWRRQNSAMGLMFGLLKRWIETSCFSGECCGLPLVVELTFICCKGHLVVFFFFDDEKKRDEILGSRNVLGDTRQ